MTALTLIQKRWNDCNILRDDGLSHGDYVEQLRYLLFDSRLNRSGFAQTKGFHFSASLRLKMADAQNQPTINCLIN